MQKKKALIILGEDFLHTSGFFKPGEIDQNLQEYCGKTFPLASDGSKSLYTFILQEISRYQKNSGLPQRHFTHRDLLATIFQISHIMTDDQFFDPVNAFIGVRHFPKVCSLDAEHTVDGCFLRKFGLSICDELIKMYRLKCYQEKSKPSSSNIVFSEFIRGMFEEYETVFVTTQPDDLVVQAIPTLRTGFDENGVFNKRKFIFRKEWSCILHLFGSIHFMSPSILSEQRFVLKWEEHYESMLQDNYSPYSALSGRAAQENNQGATMWTIAYSLLLQELYRTYVSHLDRLILQADNIIVLGQSLPNELHELTKHNSINFIDMSFCHSKSSQFGLTPSLKLD